MGGDKAKNPMRDLKIRKLCLNICVGESGDRLTRAGKVMINDRLITLITPLPDLILYPPILPLIYKQ